MNSSQTPPLPPHIPQPPLPDLSCYPQQPSKSLIPPHLDDTPTCYVFRLPRRCLITSHRRGSSGSAAARSMSLKGSQTSRRKQLRLTRHLDSPSARCLLLDASTFPIISIHQQNWIELECRLSRGILYFILYIYTLYRHHLFS